MEMQINYRRTLDRQNKVALTLALLTPRVSTWMHILAEHLSSGIRSETLNQEDEPSSRQAETVAVSSYSVTRVKCEMK